MSTVERILREALVHGARVYLKDGGLAIRGGRGLPPEVMTDLRDRKAEIVAYLEGQRGVRARGAAGEPPPIVPRPPGEEVPLSYAQQRLWFLDRLEGGSGQYNVPAPVRARGELDVPALRAALRTIVERHEAVRTLFRETDGEPVQVVLEPGGFDLPRVNLSGLTPDRRRGESRRLLRHDARRPFDLARETPLRVTLIELSDRDRLIAFTMHHIASDGWSMGVLRRELGTLYEAYVAGEPNPLPPLPVQYPDFAVWQRRWLRGELLEEQLGYWRERLADLPTVHGLPLDHPRPARQGFAAGVHHQTLRPHLRERLRRLEKETGATLFMVLHAAFSVVLGRLSHQADVVVGSPIAGRVHRDLEGLVGFFANTLVLRGDLSGDPTFRQVLARSRETLVDAFDHQHVPFEMLVETLSPERSLGHSPLFQVLLVVHNIRAAGRFDLEPSRFERPEGGTVPVVRFDLELDATETDEGLELRWTHKRDLFLDSTVVRWAETFARLLEALTSEPDRGVWSVPLLSGAERQQVLVDWNATGPVSAAVEAGGRDGGLHGRFLARAALRPEAVAVVEGGRRWSYAALRSRAGALARRLRALGVGPERVVGVCLDRSAEAVAALLGVLEAGGAYLPLDPKYPRDRLERMLGDSGAVAVVSRSGLAEELPWQGPTVWVSPEEGPDECREGGVEEAGAEAPAPIAPTNLAYVLFTSGSTGVPKGVAVTHRSAVQMVEWAGASFDDASLSSVLASTSLSFDLSVFELFVPLSRGGTVVMAEDALALASLAEAPRVRLVNTVPSAASALLEMGGLGPSVSVVNLAGEALPRSLVDRLYEGAPSDRRVWNLYGPSEDTTYSTAARIPREERSAPRIGRPIAATRAYVVDPWGAPVAPGVPGELWLAGAGLARGYLGRPSATAERFVPDPFGEEAGARAYRTGDRVRHRGNGELDFLGRLDHQVKVRGFRIEPGEIEAALRAVEGVEETVVVAREDGDDRRLVAYVVGGKAGAPPEDALRARLRERLPAHTVPSTFVTLDALPLTPNGKVDRKALPAPRTDRQGAAGEVVAPRDPLELELVHLWEEILGVHPVGVFDDFFSLGGHSLLAVQLVERIAGRLGRPVLLLELFQNPTIAGIARSLRAPPGERDSSPLVALQPAGRRRRFYCVHPAGGHLFYYLKLSRLLGEERPFYGFEAHGLENGGEPDPTVEEMAARYVAALRRADPDGPYALGGWSMGGVVAYEMACQLADLGGEVSLLALIDARLSQATLSALGEASEPRAVPVAAGEVAVAAATPAGDRGAATGAPPPEEPHSYVEHGAQILREGEGDGRDLDPLDTAFAGGDPDALARYRRHIDRVLVTHFNALQSYRPRTFGGRVVFYHASARERHGSAPRGWRELVLDGLTVREIDTTHSGVLREPAVIELAALLDEDLP